MHGTSDPGRASLLASNTEITVLGGGIIGLAVAQRLGELLPERSLLLLEKEPALASHQSGHNSGVIHSGLYYRPGSERARLCVEGAARLRAFCRLHGIAHAICGKVVVASCEAELPRLAELQRRGLANGLADLAWLETTAGVVRTRFLVTCAGLHADRVAALASAATGWKDSARIVPFRGEYRRLRRGREGLVRGLIYPVPDPRLPFLGVHLTPTTEGRIEAGPNAVLALHREGYAWSKISLRDSLELLGHAGFRRLVRRHWRQGWIEIRRSLSRSVFARALQRLVPEIGPADLERGGAGVRALALDSSGELLDEFVFVARPRALHVINAPSPAATASLSIGEAIATRVVAAL